MVFSNRIKKNENINNNLIIFRHFPQNPPNHGIDYSNSASKHVVLFSSIRTIVAPPNTQYY
jgi:hypothetical protein